MLSFSVPTSHRPHYSTREPRPFAFHHCNPTRNVSQTPRVNVPGTAHREIRGAPPPVSVRGPSQQKGSRATCQHLKGQGKPTMGSCHRSYSHPSLLQQDWVLHHPQKKFSRGGGGGDVGSPSWYISTQRRPRSMGPCRLGLHGQHLHLAWTQECLLFAGGGAGVPGCLQGLTFH